MRICYCCGLSADHTYDRCPRCNSVFEYNNDEASDAYSPINNQKIDLNEFKDYGGLYYSNGFVHVNGEQNLIAPEDILWIYPLETKF